MAAIAVLLALAILGPAEVAADCCSGDEAPGCETPSCEAAVCAEDAFCCDLAWDAGCAAQATVRCPETCAGLDPFLCYKTRRNAGGEKFQPRAVDLDNVFDTKTFEVKKPEILCNPADVESVAATHTGDPLEGYRIRRAKGEPGHVKVQQVAVLDRFGSLELRTIKEQALLVPSAMSLGGPVGPPGAPGIEHFTCYKVRPRQGAENFPKGVQAQVVDPFGQPKLYDLKKPSRLCVPSDTNDAGLSDDQHHLLCYRVKRAKGEPKHAKVAAIHAANQFGSEILDTRRESELCIASLIDAP